MRPIGAVLNKRIACCVTLALTTDAILPKCSLVCPLYIARELIEQNLAQIVLGLLGFIALDLADTVLECDVRREVPSRGKPRCLVRCPLWPQ